MVDTERSGDEGMDGVVEDGRPKEAMVTDDVRCSCLTAHGYAHGTGLTDDACSTCATAVGAA